MPQPRSWEGKALWSLEGAGEQRRGPEVAGACAQHAARERPALEEAVKQCEGSETNEACVLQTAREEVCEQRAISERREQEVAGLLRWLPEHSGADVQHACREHPEEEASAGRCSDSEGPDKKPLARAAAGVQPTPSDAGRLRSDCRLASGGCRIRTGVPLRRAARSRGDHAAVEVAFEDHDGQQICFYL